MRGVVIGKFYPPHLGHNYLIDTALAGCDGVDVLVVDSPDYHMPAESRREWLQARHPKATVRIIPDLPGKDDDSEAWALHTIKFLGRVPDVVYASMDYAVTWAAAMGCKHVEVDTPRIKIPISATEIRKDILKSWRFLSNETKRGLAIRIVVLGAESTGTTTLSRELAEALNEPWAPELGRFYTESLLATDKKWTNEDFYRIGKLQQDYQDAMAELSNGVVVYDTNAVATEVWQRRYMGRTTPAMEAIGAREKVDLYIITGDEIPFVQDGIRDGEHMRHKMHKWFVSRIKKTGVPYVIASGPRGRRLATALKAAERVVAEKRTIT
ncbi:MAG: AAA family ATPase [Candidatus Saccharimonas sp.]